jgi:hypothetical protein
LILFWIAEQLEERDLIWTEWPVGKSLFDSSDSLDRFGTTDCKQVPVGSAWTVVTVCLESTTYPNKSVHRITWPMQMFGYFGGKSFQPDWLANGLSIKAVIECTDTNSQYR